MPPTSTCSPCRRCAPPRTSSRRASRLGVRERRGAREGPRRRRHRHADAPDRGAPGARSRAARLRGPLDRGRPRRSSGERLTVVSAYVPTGEADTPRQDAKWAFLDAMEARMPVLAAASPLSLIMGDLNVGHRELDIRNWKGNVKKAGFLPRERAYFDRFLGEAGAEVTGVDGSTGPRARLGRRRAALPRRGRRAVHLVVGARPRVRQRHRVAHRLPPRDPRARGARHPLRGRSARPRGARGGATTPPSSRTTRSAAEPDIRMPVPPGAASVTRRSLRRATGVTPASAPRLVG